MKETDLLNIVVIGGPRVGKTSLIRNFIGLEFLEKSYPTDPYYINMETNYRDVISSQGWPLHLNVVDIGGCENFRISNSPFTIKIQAIIICYDVTDSKSWMGALRRLDDSLSLYTKVYFCGTKTDLIKESFPRQVRLEDVNAIAKHSRSKVFEISATEPSSSTEIFSTIIDDFVERLPAYKAWNNSFTKRIFSFFAL